MSNEDQHIKLAERAKRIGETYGRGPTSEKMIADEVVGAAHAYRDAEVEALLALVAAGEKTLFKVEAAAMVARLKQIAGLLRENNCRDDLAESLLDRAQQQLDAWKALGTRDERALAEQLEEALHGKDVEPCPHLPRTLHDCHWPSECQKCRLEIYTRVLDAVATAPDATSHAVLEAVLLAGTTATGLAQALLLATGETEATITDAMLLEIVSTAMENAKKALAELRIENCEHKRTFRKNDYDVCLTCAKRTVDGVTWT